MKFRIPALIFHLLPIIPFALRYTYGGIAAILLVAVAYIKVQKLRAIEAEQKLKHGKVDESFTSAKDFWESLTFLK